MRVLIEITHPAFVHLFRNLITLLHERGHETLVFARDKDVTLELLDDLGIEYVCPGPVGVGFVGMGKELLTRSVRLLDAGRRFRPDVMLAVSGVTLGLAGVVLGVPRVVLDEAEHARLQRALGLPFATYIFTGTGYLGDHGPRHRRFRGIWVQAYLDPKYFRPSRDVLRRFGVDADSPYIVVRKVAWGAAHDAGLWGQSEQEDRVLVERIGRYGRVFISSESPLGGSLRAFRNPVPAMHVHHLLAFASLYIGEGGTMAAEAAVLGTPAVFSSPLRCGYLLALEERYGLLYNTNSFREGVEIAESILNRPDRQREWKEKRAKLLAESEDVVEFMYDLLREAAAGSRGRGGNPK